MKTIFYDVVDDPTLEKILNDIQNFRPERIVIFSETEWYSSFLNPQLANVCNEFNVQVVITFCSFPHSFYEDQIKLFNNIDVQYWSSFWVNWSLMCSNNLNYDRSYENFDYPFICLNNKNHEHRCMLVDQLAKNNLIDSGIVTWHRFPNNKPSANLQYYDDKIRTIDDNFETLLDSFLVPPIYHQSFLHVIGEATSTVTCISEKTFLPIMHRKPWIIMSNAGFHRDLQSLGFELYDEIIDYSFDSEPEMIKRAEAIAENVKRIVGQDVNELYKIIKPKADKNYETFMKISKSSDYVPKIIKERISMMAAGDPIRVFTDPRYLHIGEVTNLI